jgi:hypothetical protein
MQHNIERMNSYMSKQLGSKKVRFSTGDEMANIRDSNVSSNYDKLSQINQIGDILDNLLQCYNDYKNTIKLVEQKLIEMADNLYSQYQITYPTEITEHKLETIAEKAQLSEESDQMKELMCASPLMKDARDSIKRQMVQNVNMHMMINTDPNKIYQTVDQYETTITNIQQTTEV